LRSKNEFVSLFHFFLYVSTALFYLETDNHNIFATFS
jgi:hypothetical protein